jgi:hypothetical protein
VQENHIVDIFVQHGLGGSLATLELGSSLLTTAMTFEDAVWCMDHQSFTDFLLATKQSKAVVVPDSMHCETMSLRS